MTTLEQKVYDHIINLDADDLMQLHNEYCEANNYHDDMIYINDGEFLDMVYPSASEFAKALAQVDMQYCYNHDFVHFDGYGDLESSDDVSDLIHGYAELVEYVINDNGNYLDLWGIEPEEDEEDEEE